jgi:hypothetical protein
MTIGSNNLMYEANEVLSAARLKPLNADPFLSDFRRKQFIHLKNKKMITSITIIIIMLAINNSLRDIHKEMFLIFNTVSHSIWNGNILDR